MRPQALLQAQVEDRVLQRRTTLRDEEPDYLGRLIAGWRANDSVRSLTFCWPLDRIDHLALHPSEKRVTGLEVNTVSPRVRLFAREANVARDDFISKGIGWRNRLSEFSAALTDATARVQAVAPDRTRAGCAAEVLDGRGRKAGAGVAIWFREPAELPYQS